MAKLAVWLPVLTTGALGVAIGLRKLDSPLSDDREKKLRKLLDRYREQLLPNAERLAELEKEFQAQLRAGLAKSVAVDGKHMMMLPTFVTRLPDGTETGECFALDLGGTNFRVMYVRLGAGKGEVAECDVEEVTLPQEVYTGPGDKLFDFLASTLKNFIDRHTATRAAETAAATGAHEAALPDPVVGFCFSFAVEQSGIASGKLLEWTKNFTCPGVVGNDPVALLSAALQRAGRPCRVAALLNDTVGVLAAQRYLDSDTEVGVILGTGTNACYVEKLSALSKWRAPAGSGASGRTAVNSEWGAFFSPALPRCLEDLAVDAASFNPGKYLFEKLLAGMHLGEIARRMLLTIAREVPGLFVASPKDAEAAAHAAASTEPGPVPPPKPLPSKLLTPGSLPTASLAAIAEDGSWQLLATRGRLSRELGCHWPSKRAADVAKEVCTLVARRSAVLAAMALLAMLRHTGWAAEQPPRPVTIAFDGGVYEKFGAYRKMIQDALAEQLGDQAAELAPLIRHTLSHDGSALGAAVLAAAAVAEADAPHPSALDAAAALAGAAKAMAAAAAAPAAAAAAKAMAAAQAAMAHVPAAVQGHGHGPAPAPSAPATGPSGLPSYPSVPK